jgi:putative addiction module CopG family antidote
MQLTLTPELERIIEQLVGTGRYADANEVVQEAVARLNNAEDRDRYVREALAKAEEQVRRGKVIEVTPEYMANFMTRVHEAKAAGMRPQDEVCPESGSRARAVQTAARLKSRAQ